MYWAKTLAFGLVVLCLSSIVAFAETCQTPVPSSNDTSCANTKWVRGFIAPPVPPTAGLRLSTYASGVGGDDGAGIQAALNAAAAAGKSLIVDTPTYVDPAGKFAWVVCSSPNGDGHGVELPASVSVLGMGWQVAIETKPGCASPPIDVFFANLASPTSSALLRDFTLDGYGLSIPLNVQKWQRYTIDHMRIRNAPPGSLGALVSGSRTGNASASGDMTVMGGTRIENVNDTGNTVYWGSRFYADAGGSQNQITLQSIPVGLVQGSAVDLLFANGQQKVCTTSSGSIYVTCVSLGSMLAGDRIIIQGGGAISTTLGATANIGATTVTIANANGIGIGDTLVINGAGTAGGNLTTTVASPPTIVGNGPAGTFSIANAIVTAVSSGGTVTATTNFITDVAALNPVGCSSPCFSAALAPTASVTSGRVADLTPGYNFSNSALPNSAAVAYVCGISGTTVSLSTSPVDPTCASPYNFALRQYAGMYVTNLPIFGAVDSGADSWWNQTYVVSGAYAELAILQNEGDTHLSDIHVFGPPPLNALYGIEMTGGSTCSQCQNDREQWAALDIGNKSNLINARVSGFILENAFPQSTLQQLGVRIWTQAVGAVMQNFAMDTGANQAIPANQIILQSGVADPSEVVRDNPGASLILSAPGDLASILSAAGTSGVNCPAGVTAATVVVVKGIVTHC